MKKGLGLIDGERNRTVGTDPDSNTSETTIPSTATASRLPVRESVWFTPEAIPASAVGAAASAVAVTGATSAASPSENSPMPRTPTDASSERSSESQKHEHPRGHRERPEGEESTRPVAVCERAEPSGQDDHHDGPSGG